MTTTTTNSQPAAAANERAAVLYHDQSFEYRGYTWRVRYERDDDMAEPWKEHDGHGVVSNWTSRAKRPGERILATDRGSYRYYDVQASTVRALAEHWGCGDASHNHPATAKREQAACAVDRDFKYLRGWCLDEWQWTIIIVELLNAGGDVVDYDSLGGIDGDHDGGKYLTSEAYGIADAIMRRVEVDDPDVVLSEN